MLYSSENKLARWCQLMTVNKMEELKEIVGDDLMEEEAREQLIEEVEGISSDDEVIALYSAYTQDELERNSIMYEETKKAREKGLREGREQGIKEGLKEGKNKKQIEIAINMLKEDMDINLISKLTNLSCEEIINLNNK